jgi:hypothetical protein
MSRVNAAATVALTVQNNADVNTAQLCCKAQIIALSQI